MPQQQHETAKVRFQETIHKNNAPTFQNLHQLVKDSKEDNNTTILKNGSLRTGQKSVLADIITKALECPSKIELQGSSCSLIEDLALVVATERLLGVQTFGHFAKSSQEAELKAGSYYQQIHADSNHYEVDSIKSDALKLPAISVLSLKIVTYLSLKSDLFRLNYYKFPATLSWRRKSYRKRFLNLGN